MKQSAKVLVIDDDARLLRLLQVNLEAEGYSVVCASSGRAGFEALLGHSPDALILDLMLPDMDGLELCERVREFSDVPIIILTARAEESHLVEGFDFGADDYIVKPFSRDELLARLRGVLRRVGFSERVKRSPDIVCGDLTLRSSDRRLIHGVGAREPVRLSHTEFKLLYFLMANADCILTTDDLIARVWGPELVGNTESLRTYIRYLRQKIETDPKSPRRIVAERGIGYVFVSGAAAKGPAQSG